MGNVVYASNELRNGGYDQTVTSKKNTEEFKAEFAFEIAKITGKIVSTPTKSIKDFKVEFTYAIAQVTAKVMPIIPSDQASGFAYKMAQITTKIISDQNLDIEKAKAEFSYEIAQLTAKIITDTDISAAANRTMFKVAAGPIEKTASGKVDHTNTNQSDIDLETYRGLINELMHVGDGNNQLYNKVNIDGEIRYHYAFNRGAPKWDMDSSGIRTRLGFNTTIDENWQVNAMMEFEKSLVKYDNEFDLARYFNAVGKVGTAKVTVGSFGYFMAEGNIYDSGFKGAKVDFGEPVKYTLSYGDSDYTRKTAIATAKYNDFDYNLEAGIYHYQLNEGSYYANTIRTLSGNYNFSNFSIGAMYFSSNVKDSKGNSSGYVFSLHDGDLKTYRPGTYDIFLKYYNQPIGTYIEHGMNGIGSLGLMQGFEGYGLGAHYTFANNLVGGIEYYDLTDEVSGEKGKTWWSELTHYF
jgi:hypothetical protein